MTYPAPLPWLLLAAIASTFITTCTAGCASTAEFGGPCGSNGACCPGGQCCSQWGFCGTTTAHCGARCQSTFGTCTDTTVPSPSPAVVQTDPPPTPASTPTSPTGGPAFAGYYQSWSSPWASTAAAHQIAHIASYVPIVNLAFMQPDNTYVAGSMAWTGTGLQFSSDPSVVKGAIALLKQTNPGTKVLVSVGGASFNNWDSLNVNGIASFVRDFGLDGVDIDYEATPACTFSGTTSVSCNTDTKIINAINSIRAALPSPYWVTAAVFSVGAYGLGPYASALPTGSSYAGMWINPLKQAGSKMDAIFVMSYDAGTSYDPKVAFAAYKSIYAGRIYMGLETPPEAWGGHVLTLSEVDSLTSYFKANGAHGMFLWSLHKPGQDGVTPTTVSQHVCTGWSMSGCTNPLFS